MESIEVSPPTRNEHSVREQTENANPLTPSLSPLGLSPPGLLAAAHLKSPTDSAWSPTTTKLAELKERKIKAAQVWEQSVVSKAALSDEQLKVAGFVRRRRWRPATTQARTSPLSPSSHMPASRMAYPAPTLATTPSISCA